MSTASKFNRSAILGYAWTRARVAAAAAGESVRLHIGAAMRAAWSEAKAVLAMVPQQAQQQQANAGDAAAASFSERRNALRQSGIRVVNTGDSWLADYLDGHPWHFRGGKFSGVRADTGDAALAAGERLLAEYQASLAEPVAAAAPVEIELELGRAVVTRIGDRIRFVGQVTGGGANGPGNIVAYIDYDRQTRLRYSEDHRSGSKRSGSVVWELEPDTLYSMWNVAVNSSRSGSFYLSTYGGTLTELTQDGLKAERGRVWPLRAEQVEAEQARERVNEAERIERETKLAAERKEARELQAAALKEANDEAAARIEAEGQPKVEGLPELTGSPKQIAYALKIREAVQRREPANRALRSATTARYWIETHRDVLFYAR